MSLDLARTHLEAFGLADRIREFTVSSATVALAAEALGCEPAHIAKSLTFHGAEGVILVVAAGDAKVDNGKFKSTFGLKAKMLCFEEVELLTGHAVGGVCPFGVKEGVSVYLDEALRRFATVDPAAGNSMSAVELSLGELEKASRALGWVDVCKLPEA